MKLSSHERAIVSYAHLQAHLSPRDIAKKTHLEGIAVAIPSKDTDELAVDGVDNASFSSFFLA